MTSFVLLIASTGARIVSTWVVSHDIHNFQEVLYLPYVTVQVFTPKILPSPVNTEFICVGKAIEKWNYQFMKEFLDIKLLVISVFDP